MKLRLVWIAALLLVAAGPLLARGTARPIGGRRADIRARERDRMQREYGAIRKARAAKLREAREATAGHDGEGVRGWRSGNYGTIAAPEFEPEPEPVDRRTAGVRTIKGAPKYLLYSLVVALSGLLVVRVRRRRRAQVTS
ncbi:MAG: hypothetical protein ABFS86_06500 [Planctomycetota bacterium]